MRTAAARPIPHLSPVEPEPRDWSTLKRSWLWIGPAMLIVVGAFDLACTLSAFESGRLVEMNPIANAVLERAGGPGLALYRFVMTALGCVLLSWGLRMYRLGRFVGSDLRRVRRVVWGGNIALITSHLALVCWWIAWLSV